MTCFSFYLTKFLAFLKFRYLRNTSIVIVILLVVLMTREKIVGDKRFSVADVSKMSIVRGKVLQNHDTTETPVKLLCYLLLSRSKLKTAKIIKETWGSHCDELVFFGGYEYPQLRVTYLNVTEGYENLWGKAKAALVYLFEHPVYQRFQYYLKADDDTFVIIENLRQFINESVKVLQEPAWFGFKLKHHKMPQGYMSGGAGYVFNNAALIQVNRLLKEKYSQKIISTCNVNGEYGIEDLELGKCFLAAGVKSVDSFDKYGRERFLPLSYEVFLNGAISSYHWIWSQSWNRVKIGEKCCSQQLISMHEISPTQIKTIYNLLYKINVTSQINKMLVKTP